MIRATQELPSAYERQGELDFSRQPALVLALSIGSTLLFALAAGLLLWALPLLRPGLLELSVTIGGLPDLLRFLLIGLALLALMIALHEGIHGLVFWAITGDRPSFGFKGLYAYAAAPDWYLPRNQHILVALAPLLLISLGGLLLLAVIPAAAVPATIMVVALNAGGAIGDIVAALWLLRRADPRALVNDTGDAIAVFSPAERAPSAAAG